MTRMRLAWLAASTCLACAAKPAPAPEPTVPEAPVAASPEPEPDPPPEPEPEPSPIPPRTLATGGIYNCAVEDGAVYCWGLDRRHPVGQAFQVEGIDDAVEVAAGMRAACARVSDGRVACWNEYSSVQWVEGVTAARNIALGPWDACAAEPSGVQCWSPNFNDDEPPVAKPMLDVDDPIQVASGFYQACALERGGTVRCWGDNRDVGQAWAKYSKLPVFSDGVKHRQSWVALRTTPPSTPRPYRKRNPDAQLVQCLDRAGGVRGPETLSVTADFDARGRTLDVRDFQTSLSGPIARELERCTTRAMFEDGYHGTEDETPHTATFDFFLDDRKHAARRTHAILEGVTSIAARGYFACATTTEGELLCWGFTHGFDGPGIHGTRLESDHAASVEGIDEAAAVTIGWRHVCVQRRDGGHRCFGSNEYGLLFGPGAPKNDELYEVVDIDPERAFVEISAGPTLGCGRRRDGVVLCWGSNDGGRLGIGADPGGSFPPTPIPGLPSTAQPSGPDSAG